MRISRPQMFMDIAHVVAKRATCMRLSVGAVIVQGRSIVAIGYNGVPAGHAHCAGNDCPGKFKCDLTTHAEINALNHVPKDLPWHLNFDLYVTDSPCRECYERMIDDGRVRRIFFGTPYRITEHLEGHVRSYTNDVEWMPDEPHCFRITPSGYIMDWRTKELVDPAT
jgi:dCMP deaminase